MHVKSGKFDVAAGVGDDEGEEGLGDEMIGEGDAAHPADEGTPSGDEYIFILRLGLVDGGLILIGLQGELHFLQCLRILRFG